MKYLLLCAGWLTLLDGLAQDFIITPAGDTLPCRLPGNIRKEGIRPVHKYLNGHIRLAVLFPNDSVRIQEPGQIRGYFRAVHGKSLLCDGYFESKKMAWKAGDTSWYFMNRVITGRFASLYRIYLWEGDVPEQYFFLDKKQGTDPDYLPWIRDRKALKVMLTEEETLAGMAIFFGKRKKFSFPEAVAEYNRLKAEARSSGEYPQK